MIFIISVMFRPRIVFSISIMKSGIYQNFIRENNSAACVGMAQF